MRSRWIASLQLRPSAPLITTFSLVCLFLSFRWFCSIADATGNSSVLEDYNRPSVQNALHDLGSETKAHGYESEFLGVDRSIAGRAEDNTALANNAPGQLNIEQGTDQFWFFPREALFGPKSPPAPRPLPPLQEQNPPVPDSPDERMLYITLSTCRQPSAKRSDDQSRPGQLKLYVSTDPEDRQLSTSPIEIPVEEGLGSRNLSAKNDIFFKVSAPDNPEFTGVYNYQLTASIDESYASYNSDSNSNVFFIDSDTTSALLYTANYTSNNSSDPEFEEWMQGPLRFSIFIHNQRNPSLVGMGRSVCALENFADVRFPTAVDSGMTVAGDGSPRQQFYVRSLNASSSYNATIVFIGNSIDPGSGVVSGGGIVWEPVTFNTKSSMLTNSPN